MLCLGSDSYNKTSQMHWFLKFIFGIKTLHVLNSSSVHQQEIFTVHTAIVYTDNTPSNFHIPEELRETMEGVGAHNTPSDFHSPEELTETSEGLDKSFLPGMYKITLLHSIIYISCMNKLLVFISITEYRNCKQSSIRWDIMTHQYFEVAVNELQTFKC